MRKPLPRYSLPVIPALAHAARTAWDDLPEPDKGILTAAVVVFGAILLVLVSAVLFASS